MLQPLVVFGLLVGCHVVFVSCRHRQNQEIVNRSPALQNENSFGFAGTETLRGTMLYANDSLWFYACEKPFHPYWVRDTAGVFPLKHMSAQAADASVFYQVEATGKWQRISKSHMGQSDSLFVLHTVNSCSVLREPAWCIPYDFLAEGPNWQLQISEAQQTLRFLDRHWGVHDVFEYFPPAQQPDRWIYESNNFASQRSLRVTIVSKNTLYKKAIYPFRVTALVNGIAYEGCAVQGRSALQENMAAGHTATNE
ncbi:MAG: hypothetical protein NZL95_09235 [Chitinophagales bacterium]|nr:hypothetical protein [Chitinophagales bacterium]MDW8428716.1 hypothetical protein [Chitinophagales bacterium]